MSALKMARFMPHENRGAPVVGCAGKTLRRGDSFEFDPGDAAVLKSIAQINAAFPGIDGADCIVDVAKPKPKPKRTARKVKPAAATPTE